LPVDDEGIRIEGASSSSDNKWFFYTRFRETPRLFMLQVGPRNFMIIRKRAFWAAELAQFRRSESTRGLGRQFLLTVYNKSQVSDRPAFGHTQAVAARDRVAGEAPAPFPRVLVETPAPPALKGALERKQPAGIVPPVCFLSSQLLAPVS
jgi:hypothetical protein